MVKKIKKSIRMDSVNINAIDQKNINSSFGKTPEAISDSLEKANNTQNIRNANTEPMEPPKDIQASEIPTFKEIQKFLLSLIQDIQKNNDTRLFLQNNISKLSIDHIISPPNMEIIQSQAYKFLKSGNDGKKLLDDIEKTIGNTKYGSVVIDSLKGIINGSQNPQDLINKLNDISSNCVNDINSNDTNPANSTYKNNIYSSYNDINEKTSKIIKEANNEDNDFHTQILNTPGKVQNNAQSNLWTVSYIAVMAMIAYQITDLMGKLAFDQGMNAVANMKMEFSMADLVREFQIDAAEKRADGSIVAASTAMAGSIMNTSMSVGGTFRAFSDEPEYKQHLNIQENITKGTPSGLLKEQDNLLCDDKYDLDTFLNKSNLQEYDQNITNSLNNLSPTKSNQQNAARDLTNIPNGCELRKKLEEQLNTIDSHNDERDRIIREQRELQEEDPPQQLPLEDIKKLNGYNLERKSFMAGKRCAELENTDIDTHRQSMIEDNSPNYVRYTNENPPTDEEVKNDLAQQTNKYGCLKDKYELDSYSELGETDNRNNALERIKQERGYYKPGGNGFKPGFFAKDTYSSIGNLLNTTLRSSGEIVKGTKDMAAAQSDGARTLGDCAQRQTDMVTKNIRDSVEKIFQLISQILQSLQKAYEISTSITAKLFGGGR